MDFNFIIKDWNNGFPFLKKYTDRTLYMVVKPFILGIRLSASSAGLRRNDVYRVYFEIKPLWLDKVGNSIFCEELNIEKRYYRKYYKRYNKIVIAENRHKELFPTALKWMNFHYGKVLRQNVDLTDFIELIKKIENHDIESGLRRRVVMSQVLQLLFGTALYLEDDTLYKYAKGLFDKEIIIWGKIRKRNKRRYSAVITCENGKKVQETKFYYTDAEIYSSSEIDKLKQEIFHDFEDKEHFFAKIEENCNLPKIAKLNVGEFVGIDEFQPTESFWDKLRFILKRNWE